MRNVNNFDIILLFIIGIVDKKLNGKNVLLVVRIDFRSKTETISIILHYVKDNMKVNGIIHQIDSKVWNNWRLDMKI